MLKINSNDVSWFENWFYWTIIIPQVKHLKKVWSRHITLEREGKGWGTFLYFLCFDSGYMWSKICITWVSRAAPHSWRHRNAWLFHGCRPSRPAGAAGCLGEGTLALGFILCFFFGNVYDFEFVYGVNPTQFTCSLSLFVVFCGFNPQVVIPKIVILSRSSGRKNWDLFSIMTRELNPLRTTAPNSVKVSYILVMVWCILDFRN